MERLTENRGARTWKLFHIGWYINLALVIVVLLAAAYYLIAAQGEEPTNALNHTIMMGAMLIIATVLLMGAGISRYEARLEGQHLELKLTLKKLSDDLEKLEKSPEKKQGVQGASYNQGE